MTDAGASTDAGAPACAIPGLEDQHCKGQICTVDGDPFLWLTKDTRFQVGALNWVATVCEEPLSGPNGASNDGVDMLWGLSLKQLRALRAGVEVRVFYGTASDVPQQFPPETQACTLELATPLPTCPEDLGDPDHRPTHVSKSGCRGPLDDYCAVCKEYPWGPTETSTWSSASGGADWYNVTSPLFPATTCTTECPACARCSYRDEEQANALPARPECLPCPAGPALDPCFSPDSCDCWCASYTRLSEDCPTVLEE